MGYASRPINTGYYAIVAQREGEIMGLLEDGTKKAAEIPMPFGGRVLLTLYWWAWKIFGPGHDWSKYDGTIRALNTPIKAMSWIFANITYTSDKDPEDDWQSAQRTFKRRKGDCEDWAIFACECLKKKYDCVYLCMYNKDSGHCELLIDDGMSGSDNKWISLGTYGYNHHKGKDYSRIIPDWPEYEDWTDYCVKDVNFKVIKSSGNRN